MILAAEFSFVSLIVGIVVGGAIVAVVMLLLPNFGLKRAQKEASKIANEAKIKADQTLKNAEIDGRTIIKELKADADREIREKKLEIKTQEDKLLQREQGIDRRDVALQQKENNLDQKSEQVAKKLNDLDKKEDELRRKIDSIVSELEKVSMMSVQEAKDELFKRAEEKSSQEIAAYMRSREEEAKEKANDNARDVLALTIQKFSQEVTCERTVSVVPLPSDDLKGRIIGREGRNIRTIEQLTGADLIIDDTPEVITVSCFNPVRREIAKTALEYLIKDGRIQPGRIEELVEKATKEINEIMHKAGEETIFQLGISKMNHELVDIIGKLKYRTSYGQNALKHSVEVAHLAGIMAAEIGADQHLARRAGLLHDIGKAIDYEVEGSHIEIGVRLAKKYGENPIVINAIEAHHGDTEPQSVIANLVIAADTLSAARPGARSETLENYIQRIEKLEELSKGFEGVSNAFAIQAGREIRVMVVPEKVDDVASYKLARDIKEKIENELTYPGQIKVTVIREIRASETAK